MFPFFFVAGMSFISWGSAEINKSVFLGRGEGLFSLLFLVLTRSGLTSSKERKIKLIVEKFCYGKSAGDYHQPL